MADVTVTSKPMVNVTITSNVNTYGVQRRFERSMTIAALKMKLELICGGSPQNMSLSVYNMNNVQVCALDNDDALLGSYPVDDDMTLHVEDPTLNAEEFTDLSKVEKFELSEESYKKRADSLRAFKEKNRLGQFNAEDRKKKEEERKMKEAAEEEKAKTIQIDDRCQVRLPGQPMRLGCVQFVGKTDFKAGVWVGVKYDEPVGKNDGSSGGKQYFECLPNYGGFIRPSHLEIGDFPEEQIDMDEM